MSSFVNKVKFWRCLAQSGQLPSSFLQTFGPGNQIEPATFLSGSVWYDSNPLITCFPSNTGSQFKGTTSTWSSKYFVLVCNFLLFNAGDLFGRFLAGLSNRLFKGRWGRWVCLTLAIVRVVFIPLFLMCNALPSPDRALPITFDKASRLFPRQFYTTFLLYLYLGVGSVGRVASG